MYKPLTKETNYRKNRNIEYWQNEYLPTQGLITLPSLFFEPKIAYKNNEILIFKVIFLSYFFQEYTLIDDTVLEEHYEDPKLTQMKLVGGKEGKRLIRKALNFTRKKN